MIYSTNLNGDVKKLTDGMYDYASVSILNDGQLLTKRHSISEADELFTLALNDNTVNRITKENDHIFNQLKTGKVEARWTKTVDGKQIEGIRYSRVTVSDIYLVPMNDEGETPITISQIESVEVKPRA